MIIQKIKQTGDSVLNYNREFAESKHRSCLLKKITQGWQDITLIIDTNQCVKKRPAEDIENYLLQNRIRFKKVNIEANKTRFFGFNVQFPSNKKECEWLFIIDITNGQFNESLFEIIKSYDIAIGLERKGAFEETSDSIIHNINNVIFEKSFFAESIYDSVVCSSLRSSSGINGIEAILNEMGL